MVDASALVNTILRISWTTYLGFSSPKHRKLDIDAFDLHLRCIFFAQQVVQLSWAKGTDRKSIFLLKTILNEVAELLNKPVASVAHQNVQKH